jgi:RHS repeat-associated protein
LIPRVRRLFSSRHQRNSVIAPGEEDEYIYFHDAQGNVGQVVGWVDDFGGASGSAWDASRLVATYEYAPYGEILASTGDFAAVNPFRFSTKYHDDETGLIDFGRRLYDPLLGRWINRDPIEEDGGINLYAYVANEPVRRNDFLGACASEEPGRRREVNGNPQAATQPSSDICSKLSYGAGSSLTVCDGNGNLIRCLNPNIFPGETCDNATSPVAKCLCLGEQAAIDFLKNKANNSSNPNADPCAHPLTGQPLPPGHVNPEVPGRVTGRAEAELAVQTATLACLETEYQKRKCDDPRNRSSSICRQLVRYIAYARTGIKNQQEWIAINKDSYNVPIIPADRKCKKKVQ